MSTNKNNNKNNKNDPPAMKHIKFTINSKKKYIELLDIIKNINSCDYYISCENNRIYYIYAHFTSSYKKCKRIIKLKVDAVNCKKEYDKVINEIKSYTVLEEQGKCPIEDNNVSNKTFSRARRYILTIDNKEKYNKLIEILKNIKYCDYYISCLTKNECIYMYIHFSTTYDLPQSILNLGISIENCDVETNKYIDQIKESGNVIKEYGECPVQRIETNEKIINNNLKEPIFNKNEININQETESMEKIFETSSDEINYNEYEPRIKGGIDEIKENSEDSNDNKYENTKEFKKNNNESTFEGRKTVGELKKITNPDELYYNKYYAWSKIHEEMNINMDVEDPPKNIEVYYIFDPSGTERISKVKEIIRNNKDKYGTAYNDVKFKYNHWNGVGHNCKIALYDNFRDTDMDVIEFNDFIDSERHILETKNEQIVNNYELIIITSIYSPYHIYENSNVYRRQWLKYIKIIDMRATKDE